METLYLGVARETITPEPGCQLMGYFPSIFAETVEDDLTATAFYFRQGGSQTLLISLTLCVLQEALSDRIRELLRQKTGVPEECCMLCATHTHTGPNTAGSVGWGDVDQAYCEGILIPAILSAAEKAAGNIRAVRMGMAHGNSMVGINRRELTEENVILLGQNPWGSFNPRMTVISFVDEQNTTVANIIHYGAHCTAAGTVRAVSRDWPGPMIDAMEAETHAITAFFNGTIGDSGPRLSNGKTTANLALMHELGKVAAADALRIYGQIPNYKEVQLLVSRETVAIPVKARMEQARAEVLLEEYKNETVNWKALVKNHLETVLRSYAEGYTEQASAPLEQIAVVLGDAVLVGFSYELFSEIGMRIDRGIPSKAVLPLSCVNGPGGYFATQDALCRGGYEVNMFRYSRLQPFCDDADFYLMKETLNHLRKILCEKET